MSKTTSYRIMQLCKKTLSSKLESIQSILLISVFLNLFSELVYDDKNRSTEKRAVHLFSTLLYVKLFKISMRPVCYVIIKQKHARCVLAKQKSSPVSIRRFSNLCQIKEAIKMNGDISNCIQLS